MKKYIVEVKEILVKEVEVFAEDKFQALDKVQDKYYNDEIVLDYSNILGVDFNVKESEKF
jgi:predicted GTPase